MRDDICTIPVSEVFEVRDGCPICRMIKTVEDRVVSYILGDAMMEPDIRIETNRLGFCAKHYEKMLGSRGRLQMALMLETHLKGIDESVFAKKMFNSDAKKAQKTKQINESCFICEKINFGLSNMFETVYRCYEGEKEFRELFNSQPQFCLPHYEKLMSGITKKKCPHYGGEMAENLSRITLQYLKKLESDVSKYCSMHDYRSNKSDADWGDSKTAVERTVAFLSGKWHE